jgi:O-antigen ligase
VVLKSGIFGQRTIGEKGTGLLSPSSIFPLMGLLLAVVLAVILGRRDEATDAFIAGAILFALVLILQQHELAVVMVIAVHLYIDWYLGYNLAALVMEFLLLGALFLARTARYHWTVPQGLWLWGLLLAVSLLPATQGITLSDGFYYYFNVIFNSFMIFWIGLVLARNIASVRRFFEIFSAFCTLMAIHTIIQATTGIFLLASSRFNAYLALVSDYTLAYSDIQRAGSFFVNPDSSGSFFGIVIFVPLCLFFCSRSLPRKLFYLAELLLMLVALLFTYSTGGWVAAAAGFLVFMLFVGHNRYRLLLPFFFVLIIFALITFFPEQINLQIQHALTPSEASLREAAWQTGIQVIRAFPLTGIGLGRYDYIVRADPYRVPQQYRPLAHPHNSYIELAALGGVPILLIFMALLAFTFWLGVRNWHRIKGQASSLYAGGLALVVALSVNSMFIPGWTLPPLVVIGWLILGIISSPLPFKNQAVETEKKNT